MAERIVLNESTMSAIGDAIREVYGEVETYLPSEMPDKIRRLQAPDDNFYLYYDWGISIYDISGTVIPSSCFQSDTSLIGASWAACTSIGNYAFTYCSSLQEVRFQACTHIGGRAFSYCSSLQEISFPVCTSISGYAFAWCSSLQEVSLPLCSSIGTYAFQSCSSLQEISFPACTYIYTSAFCDCSSLRSAYFMASSLCSLDGSGVFNNTHASLSVYVPASLLSQYQVASYWSDMSSRLVGV